MTLEVLLSSTREFSDHPLIFVIFNNKTSVLVTFFTEKITMIFVINEYMLKY